MSTFDLLPELAARLDELVPMGVSAGDWNDVLRRTRPAVPARRRLLPLKLAIAIAVFLLLAGVATATYFILSGRTAGARLQPGALTVIAGGYNRASEIVEVRKGGRVAVVWRCPGDVFCGELTSVDWSPDGRRVAFTLDEIGGGSAYVGLHILDLKSGRDLHIPSVSPAHPLAPHPASYWADFLSKETRRIGCVFPAAAAWSPDSRTLAYACESRRGSNAHSEIHTISSDGTEWHKLQTGLPIVGWPTWSPDGKRIAFEGSATAGDPSSIYVIRLDGSGRVLIARHASLPDWSPDGRTIAYRSPDGIKLVTPGGVDVTPHHGRPHARIAPKGAPSWSLDGSKLAVGTQRGVYLVGRNGAHLTLVIRDGGTGAFGPVRPAWYPGVNPTGAIRHENNKPSTSTCGEC